MTRTVPIDPLAWVALARSRDASRPVLQGIHVREDAIEATDGHRVHITPHESTNLTLGIYQYNNGTRNAPILGLPMIDGTYPNVKQVIPTIPADWKSVVLFGEGLRHARAMCKAAEAANAAFGVRRSETKVFHVSVESVSMERAHYDGAYLFDVLSMWDSVPLQFYARTPLSPARIQDADGSRIAILMPVRKAIVMTRFAIDEYLTRAETAK